MPSANTLVYGGSAWTLRQPQRRPPGASTTAMSCLRLTDGAVQLRSNHWAETTRAPMNASVSSLANAATAAASSSKAGRRRNPDGRLTLKVCIPEAAASRSRRSAFRDWQPVQTAGKAEDDEASPCGASED